MKGDYGLIDGGGGFGALRALSVLADVNPERPESTPAARRTPATTPYVRTIGVTAACETNPVVPLT